MYTPRTNVSDSHRTARVLKEEPSKRGGYYRAGYEDYGELIQQMSEGLHQSCLILTSREKPKEISALESQDAPVRSLILRGSQKRIEKQHSQAIEAHDKIDQIFDQSSICIYLFRFLLTNIQNSQNVRYKSV